MKNEELVDGNRRSVDPKHAPVPLPAGSFDMTALVKGLDRAHDAKDRPGAVHKALEGAAAEGTNLIATDRREREGFRFVDVENEDLGITERFQVEDKAKGDDAPPPVKSTRTSSSKRGRKAAAKPTVKPVPEPVTTDPPTDPAPAGAQE